MKHLGCDRYAEILIPETLEEAGIMQWLYKRYEGKAVTLLFDTTTVNDKNNYPAFWIKEK